MHINSVSTLHFEHKHQQGQKSLPSLAPQPSFHCQYNNLTDLFSFVFAGTFTKQNLVCNLQGFIQIYTVSSKLATSNYIGLLYLGKGRSQRLGVLRCGNLSTRLHSQTIFYMLGTVGHMGYVVLRDGNLSIHPHSYAIKQPKEF
jgi:hypothetical protein